MGKIYYSKNHKIRIKRGTNLGQNIFSLLLSKNILSILDGDKSFGTLEISKSIRLAMPYLSGPQLCELSNTFGLPVTYPSSGGAKSRWEYLKDLMGHCIKNNTINKLLKYLFSKKQFYYVFANCTSDEIEKGYNLIVNTVIEHIDGELYLSGYEFVYDGNNFIIKSRDNQVSIPAPTFKQINRDYITTIADRAEQDVSNGYYDSAITKCRTLIEEVFCYVIEKRCENPTSSGDIEKLYRQVKTIYNMHQNQEIDKRINNLLSGLEKIVSSIAEMRNINSDAHGVGAKRIKIQEHHARLLVNSAITISEFILAIGENAE